MSRYKTSTDFLKAHRELRTKLSERPTVARLQDGATPEQVAEYRKGLGLPDVAADAKSDAYMQAYKIEFPKDYTPSEVEKGLVGDYAKAAYESGMDPVAVKKSIDFFMRQQSATEQAINKANVEKQRNWQGELRDKLGSRNYEAQTNVAKAWLAQQFDGKPDELANILGAQLPGGGRLGDHPWLFDVITRQAMADGFTSDVEAVSMESGGKSLAEQQSEIEALYRTDRRKYDEPQTQARLDKLIKLRVERGEIDEYGNTIRQRRSA